MKKILIVSLTLAAAGWVNAQIQPIEGSNEVGFSTLAAAAGANQIITVPYVACMAANGAVVLADLVSTNGLVAAGTPGSADQLIVMVDVSGNLRYYYYWLQSGIGWTGVETTVKHPDGSQSILVPPAASAFEVARGLGFWLKRVSGSANAVYVKGEVSASNPSTAIVAGLNLIGYGSAAALNLNAVSWSGAYGNSTSGNTAHSDKIIVINSDGTMANYYFFACPEGWPQAYQDLNGKWIDQNYAVASVPVPAGQGFWYLRRAAGSFNFQPDGN